MFKFGERWKYWGAFLAGILWGLSVTMLIGVLYFKTSAIQEIECKSGFDEIVKRVPSVVGQFKNWRVEPVVCAVPLTSSNCRMKAFKLCNGEYAKIMLDDPESRRVSCMIPCTFAVYEKENGKTYIARVNVSLFGRILGGLPGRIFPGSVEPEQQKMLKEITK